MKQQALLKKIIGNIKKLTFLKLSAFLFYAFIFLIPFQVAAVIYTSPIYQSGNFNPYTSFFYYLTDIVFLLSLVCWGISIVTGEFKSKLTYGKWFIFVLLILFVLAGEISILLAEDKFISLMLVIRLAELLLIYFYMVNDVVKLDIIINVFIASMSFQAVIAFIQYIYQGPVGLHMLGEPAILPESPGIAKIDVDSMKILRSYGTFQHPNIFAGYLVVAILLAFYRARQKEHIAYPIMILLIAALILTFSRSAVLALFAAGLVFLSIKEMKVSFKYIFLALSLLILFLVVFDLESTIVSKLFFTDTASFDERVFYFSIAKKIMYENPLGIGLGNFTILMQDFSGFKLAPWDFQPVHNIYMLLLNEMGFFGLGIFAALLLSFAVYLFVRQSRFRPEKNNPGAFILASLVALGVIGLFDHYLVSLYHGQLLLFFVFGLSGKYIMLRNR